MPCMNLSEPHEIYMPPPGQMSEGHDPTPDPSYWSQIRGSHGFCRSQCWIGLSPGYIQLSTRDACLRYQETQSYWRKKNKCKSSIQEAQAKLNQNHEIQGSHNEVHTDGSKMNEGVGAAVAINRQSRLVRQPADNCQKNCQSTAPSLLLRLQPSVWHWPITKLMVPKWTR